MSVPVRLSNRLQAQARTSAVRFHRSMAQQVEHWAQLGRVVEAALSTASVARLKELALIPKVEAALEEASTPEGRIRVMEMVRETGAPYYSADPDRADGVIEHRPDGGEMRGRFVNRRFVPERPAGKKPSRRKSRRPKSANA